MNPEAQAKLNQLSDKPVGELTQTDKEFLFARRSYIGPRGQRRFGEIFAEMEKAAGIKVKEEKKAAKESKKASKAPVVEPEKKSDGGSKNPFTPEEDEDDEDEDPNSSDEDSEDEDKALG